MPQLNNTMEILKLLNKSNCRECGSPTCLAFAAAVFRGQKHLSECPHLESDIVERFGEGPASPVAVEKYTDEPLKDLKERLAAIDLSSAARRLGAKYGDNRLTVKVCGKDFSVDSEGNFFSEIHIHSWITGPLLNYIIDGAGKPVAGEWVSFRELKGGKDWYQFFVHQCENRFKKVADTYPDLFEDMLHIFNGKRVDNHYQSDISLVLHPFPRLPILFCYWKPEDGLDSNLNIFFDSTAGDNLNVQFIYSLGTGLATMFEKVTLRHGY